MHCVKLCGLVNSYRHHSDTITSDACCIRRTDLQAEPMENSKVVLKELEFVASTIIKDVGTADFGGGSKIGTADLY